MLSLLRHIISLWPKLEVPDEHCSLNWGQKYPELAQWSLWAPLQNPGFFLRHCCVHWRHQLKLDVLCNTALLVASERSWRRRVNIRETNSRCPVVHHVGLDTLNRDSWRRWKFIETCDPGLEKTNAQCDKIDGRKRNEERGTPLYLSNQTSVLTKWIFYRHLFLLNAKPHSSEAREKAEIWHLTLSSIAGPLRHSSIMFSGPDHQFEFIEKGSKDFHCKNYGTKSLKIYVFGCILMPYFLTRTPTLNWLVVKHVASELEFYTGQSVAEEIMGTHNWQQKAQKNSCDEICRHEFFYHGQTWRTICVWKSKNQQLLPNWKVSLLKKWWVQAVWKFLRYTDLKVVEIFEEMLT